MPLRFTLDSETASQHHHFILAVDQLPAVAKANFDAALGITGTPGAIQRRRPPPTGGMKHNYMLRSTFVQELNTRVHNITLFFLLRLQAVGTFSHSPSPIFPMKQAASWLTLSGRPWGN